MKIRVYVEGGGNNEALRTRCRRGFREFFRKAGLEGRMPRISASGSRSQAYDDFRFALSKARADEFIALLVDSEAPVADVDDPWAHLEGVDRWKRPSDAGAENAHLMVQCMEAWFLADKDTLAVFFGNGFRAESLPAHPDLEDAPRDDVLNGLKAATARCATKRYGKGRPSFEVLEAIDPAKVMAVSGSARRLVDTLLRKANPTCQRRRYNRHAVDLWGEC